MCNFIFMMYLMAKSKKASGEEKPEKPISLAIAASIHRKFAIACKERPVGRSMNDAGTRLVSWFCRQESLVQAAVTGDVDDGMEIAYANALRRLAQELEDKAKRRDMGHDKPDEKT